MPIATASNAGLKANDVILVVDGVSIRNEKSPDQPDQFIAGGPKGALYEFKATERPLRSAAFSSAIGAKHAIEAECFSIKARVRPEPVRSIDRCSQNTHRFCKKREITPRASEEALFSQEARGVNKNRLGFIRPYYLTNGVQLLSSLSRRVNKPVRPEMPQTSGLPPRAPSHLRESRDQGLRPGKSWLTHRPFVSFACR